MYIEPGSPWENVIGLIGPFSTNKTTGTKHRSGQIQNVPNYNAASLHARVGSGEKLRFRRHGSRIPSKGPRWVTFRFIQDIYLVL